MTRDGVGSDIGIGTYHPLVDNAPGTARSNQVDSLDSGATRDGHFAEYWNNTVTGDIAYILSYTPTPVPEPATGALCALGLAVIAVARRR